MEFPPYRHQIVFQSDCTSFSLSCNIYEFVTPFKFRNGHSILTELCATLTLIYKWLQFSLWVWVAMTSTSGSSWSSHVVSKVKGSTMIVCLMGLNYTSQKTAPLLGPADFLWDGQECRVEGSFCPLTTHCQGEGKEESGRNDKRWRTRMVSRNWDRTGFTKTPLM